MDDGKERIAPRWSSPPQDVMGAVITPSGAVLRTDNVFVGLRRVIAHPTRVGLSAVIAARRDGPSDER